MCVCFLLPAFAAVVAAVKKKLSLAIMNTQHKERECDEKNRGKVQKF